MIIGNCTVLNKSPMRKFAGVTESAERSNWGASGARRNAQMRQGATTANQLYSLPAGTYAGLAWFLPQQVGEISSHDGPSRSSVTGVLAGGKNFTGSADGTSEVSGAINLLAYGIGAASGATTVSGAIFGTAPIVGSSEGASSATGSITATISVTGQSSSESTVLGQVSGALAVTGSASSTSAVEGALFAGAFFSGAASSESSLDGFVFGVRYATGAAGSSATVSGTVTGLGWMSGSAASASSASMVTYATGLISGESTTVQTLSPDGLAKAVWNSVAAQYGDGATMGARLNSAASGGVDYAALGLAVWEHAQRSLTETVDANMVQVKGHTVSGAGTAIDPWGPA
jgi:hypothetical protein